MVILGEKITLRQMKPHEVKLIYEWANNPDVIPYWYGKRKSLKQIKEDWGSHYFSDANPYSGRCFAIEVKDTPIGMINHNKIDRDNKSVSIDIVIGQKESWNRGYGTDALRAFVGYLFRKFRLNRIWLGAYVHNLRAIKAYKKVGFRREGILREDAWIKGKFVNTVIFSILQREFKKQRSKKIGCSSRYRKSLKNLKADKRVDNE